MTSPEEAQHEDIDRSPPMGVFLSGEAFLKSALHLHTAAEEMLLRFPHKNMPIYYLYCHAIELALKAYLRAKGLSAKTLRGREYGHQLKALWVKCLDEGLAFDPITCVFVEQCIDLLAPYATNYEFRYIQVGFKTLPELDAVRSTAQDLFNAVRPTCRATVSSSIPNRD